MLSAALLLFGAEAKADQTQAANARALPTASVHFESNVTDGDVEVVFKAKGEDAGLVGLKVLSPDGRPVVDFRAPDKTTLGIRQFHFESPEPKDTKALKAAYPEGKYMFSATTASGAVLTGRSVLSHRLPGPVTITAPKPEAKDISTKGLRISWTPVADATAYIVEIEHDELGTRVEATVRHPTTSFSVPEGFLLAGQEYELSIGSVLKNGNTAFVETKFTTKK
jgi:hypothetical protein